MNRLAEQPIAKRIELARRYLIDLIGVDIYLASGFWEHAICAILGFSATSRSDLVDCIGDFRVEVKYATISRFGEDRTRFQFKDLWGRSKSTKMADVYVMVGYDHFVIRFYVIPTERLKSEGEKKKNFDIAFGKRGQYLKEWYKYEVVIDRIKEACYKAYEHKEHYEGLDYTNLFCQERG